MHTKDGTKATAHRGHGRSPRWCASRAERAVAVDSGRVCCLPILWKQ